MSSVSLSERAAVPTSFATEPARQHPLEQSRVLWLQLVNELLDAEQRAVRQLSSPFAWRRPRLGSAAHASFGGGAPAPSTLGRAPQLPDMRCTIDLVDDPQFVELDLQRLDLGA